MHEESILFLVLAVYYAWECLAWVPRGSIALLRYFRPYPWTARAAGELYGNARGGLAWCNPLPPLGDFICSAECLVAIEPEAIVVEAGPRAREATIPFDSVLRFRARGRVVYADGRRLAVFPGGGAAVDFANHLETLRQAPARERPVLAEQFLRARFDLERAQARWNEFTRRSRRVRLLANGFFIFLFLVTPGLVWQVGLRQVWPVLLGGWALLGIGIAHAFHRQHRFLYPKENDERFNLTLTFLLSPVAAVRAHDALSRSLLAEFHPLALVRLFCPREVFIARARRQVVQLQYRLAGGSAGGVEREGQAAGFHAARLQRIQAFIAAEGIAAAVQQPPARLEPGAVAYCPSCHAEFMVAGGGCADCNGIPLNNF